MAPPAIGVIISDITSKDDSNICQLFFDVIEEIFSHPKDEILKCLIYIKDLDIFLLRTFILAELLKLNPPGYEHLKYADENVLRKRYKATCYEDIFLLGISIVEKKRTRTCSKSQ